MRAGLKEAQRLGIHVHRHETIRPLGDGGWLIADRDGFTPCPWAVELAQFSPVRRGDRIVDLGCGAGALAVAIAQAQPEIESVLGVEIDFEYAEQGVRNLQLNGMSRSTIIRGDIRAVPLRPAFDVVVTNPPFYPPDWGRQSRDPRVAKATHAMNGDITDFVMAAARIMKPTGLLTLVYDSGRLAEALMALSSQKLTAKKIRFLDDDRGYPARVLILAGPGSSGVYVDRVSYPVQGDPV